MQHKTAGLNGDFGLMIDGVSRADLEDAVFQREAYDLWTDNGGLVALRGADLAETSAMAYEAMARAVECGPTPAMVAGDFNAELCRRRPKRGQRGHVESCRGGRSRSRARTRGRRQRRGGAMCPAWAPDSIRRGRGPRERREKG